MHFKAAVASLGINCTVHRGRLSSWSNTACKTVQNPMYQDFARLVLSENWGDNATQSVQPSTSFSQTTLKTWTFIVLIFSFAFNLCSSICTLLTANSGSFIKDRCNLQALETTEISQLRIHAGVQVLKRMRHNYRTKNVASTTTCSSSRVLKFHEI